MGIISGLTVSVNGVSNQNVDILTGSGYVPSGELITVTTTQTNIVLADYTGVPNYICLFYTEVYSLPEAHEDQATTFNTAATGSFRVRAYTKTQFNALPATSADMTVDAQDRALICAVVSGAGVGVALTASNIQNTSTWASITTVTQPTTPGLLVIGVDQNTSIGTGTLTLSYPLNASPTLTWAAPSGAGTDTHGAAVSLPADGDYTITSTNGRTITLRVVVLQLPGVGATMSLVVTSLYGQAVPHFSARDEQHRHMVGAGQPSAQNPHGLTFADLGGTTDTLSQDHQHIWHANGIVKTGIFSDQLSRTPFNLSLTRDGTHKVLVTTPGPVDIGVVDGKKVTVLAGTGTVTFTDVAVDRVELYGIYLLETGVVNHGVTWASPEGTIDPQPRVQVAPAGTSTNPFAGTLQPVNISDNWQPTTFDTVWIVYTGDVASGTLALAADASGAPDTSYTRYAVPRPSTAQGAGIVRLYMDDGARWMDVWVDTPHWFAAASTQVQVRVCPEPIVDQNLRIGYVVSHGTSHVLGYNQLNVESASSTNLIMTRYFGTTSDANLRDDTIWRLRDRAISERGVDGYTSGFDVGALNTGVLALSGGVAYINGTRYEVKSQKLTGVSPDGRWYIYLSVTDSMYLATPLATTNVTTAMAGLPLWAIDITTGAITAKYKIARNVSKIEDKNIITVDPKGLTGQFSTLSGAIEFIKQMRAAGKPVASTIRVKYGILTETAQIQAISDISIEGEPGAVITSPTTVVGGTMTTIDCGGTTPATDVSIVGLAFDVSGATAPIGVRLWSSSDVIGCTFSTTNAAANPRGVRIGDGVAAISRVVIQNSRFMLSTSTLPAIEKASAITNGSFQLNTIGDGAGSLLKLEDTTALVNLGGSVIFGTSTSTTRMSIGNNFGINDFMAIAEGPSGFRIVNDGNTVEHFRIVGSTGAASFAGSLSSGAFSASTGAFSGTLSANGGLAVAGAQTITMGSNVVTNVAAPLATTDAANKTYVDGKFIASGITAWASVTVSGGVVTVNGTNALTYDAASDLNGGKLKFNFATAVANSTYVVQATLGSVILPAGVSGVSTQSGVAAAGTSVVNIHHGPSGTTSPIGAAAVTDQTTTTFAVQIYSEDGATKLQGSQINAISNYFQLFVAVIGV